MSHVTTDWSWIWAPTTCYVLLSHEVKASKYVCKLRGRGYTGTGIVVPLAPLSPQSGIDKLICLYVSIGGGWWI